MADTNLGVKLTGDTKDLENKLARVERRYAKLEERMKQGAATGKRGADEHVGALVSLAASYISIQGAVSLATRALADYEEQAQRAHDAQRVGGGEAIELSRNLPLGVDRVAFDARLAQISAGTGQVNADGSPRGGIPIGELETAAGSAFSARRNLSPDAVTDVIAAAARLHPEGGTALAGKARGGVSALEVTPGATAEQGLGFLEAVSSTSNVEDATLFGQNVAPTIAALTRYGNTTEQAGEIASLLTNIAEDTTGKLSGNAAQKLAKQFTELGVAGNNTSEQLETLFADPELAKRVFGKLSLDTKPSGGVRELLLGGEDSNARQLYRNIQAEVPSVGDESQAVFDAHVKKLTATPRGQAYVEDRRQKEVKEALDAGRISDARWNEVGTITDDTLAGMGVGYIDRGFAHVNRSGFMFGDGPDGTIARARQGIASIKNVGAGDAEQQDLVRQNLSRLDAIIVEMKKLNATQEAAANNGGGAIVPPNNAGTE